MSLDPRQLLRRALFNIPRSVKERARRETEVIRRVQWLQHELSRNPWPWHAEALLMSAPGLRQLAALHALSINSAADGVATTSAATGSGLGFVLSNASASVLVTPHLAAVLGLGTAAGLAWTLRSLAVHSEMRRVSPAALTALYEASVEAQGLPALDAPYAPDQPSLVSMMMAADDSFSSRKREKPSRAALLATLLGQGETPLTVEGETVRSMAPRIQRKMQIIHTCSQDSSVRRATHLLQQWDLMRKQLPQP